MNHRLAGLPRQTLPVRLAESYYGHQAAIHEFANVLLLLSSSFLLSKILLRDRDVLEEASL